MASMQKYLFQIISFILHHFLSFDGSNTVESVFIQRFKHKQHSSTRMYLMAHQ